MWEKLGQWARLEMVTGQIGGVGVGEGDKGAAGGVEVV